MKEEVMNDAMDDAMEDEGDEEETYDKIFFYNYKLGQKIPMYVYCIQFKNGHFCVYRM